MKKNFCACVKTLGSLFSSIDRKSNPQNLSLIFQRLHSFRYYLSLFDCHEILKNKITEMHSNYKRNRDITATKEELGVSWEVFQQIHNSLTTGQPDPALTISFIKRKLLNVHVVSAPLDHEWRMVPQEMSWIGEGCSYHQ